ncbi:prolipoprotein diacylglyceryl transferase family protein [Citrifermentans bremense]|uniref:prolipoprotein diacylglyceryl transferase family protein n=1 Tax=Citrifermentans bremense TaxID=60035 RepID=UPI00041A510F|nr:prolipoprotein diacylglyceryl transferase family protein [Citrifermentans bremense]
MTETLFILGLAAGSALYLCWGWRTLPAERWQIAASVPIRKTGDGSWAGANLTWYGILTANAYVAAGALALLLMGAAGIPFRSVAAIVFLLLAACVPASRLVAQLVEGKANTFTVGGAVFVGTLLAPWIVVLVNRCLGDSAPIPPLAALAAIGVAYAFGEGYGRLACMSFGCCYGKPLAACHPKVASLFSPIALTFTGKTKKIAYASGLDGVKVLPVQGITYFLYCGAGIAGTCLFLKAQYGAAFLLTLSVTQAWRVVSEFFRDDYRGAGRLSAYQWMGMIGVCYGAWAAWHFGGKLEPLPDLGTGLSALWNPAPILLLQGLWGGIFLYTGLSRVTAARLSFHVQSDKV